jgi:hypothetical protein
MKKNCTDCKYGAESMLFPRCVTCWGFDLWIAGTSTFVPAPAHVGVARELVDFMNHYKLTLSNRHEFRARVNEYVVRMEKVL